MNPATILLIVQGVQAAIAAAPGVIEIVDAAKDFIGSLFSAGVITAEQQNAICKHVDDIVAAFDNGNVPPEFKVEPDPPTGTDPAYPV